MEARLFCLSIWCALYGAAVRWVARHDDWLENKIDDDGAQQFFLGDRRRRGRHVVRQLHREIGTDHSIFAVFAAVGL